MKRILAVTAATLLTLGLMPLSAFADRPILANPHKDNPRKRITTEERLQAAEARKAAADPAQAEKKKNRDARKAKKRAQKHQQTETSAP